MGVRLFSRPALDKPVLIAAWPGIGNVGVIAVDHLRNSLITTDELGEIEGWEFFYPKGGSVIQKGVLKEMKFPENRFWFSKIERDLMIFISESQPWKGSELRRMADLVLDVAEEFGCQRIYTAAAAVAPIHHTQRSRVWLAANTKDLMPELRRYENAILMSEITGSEGQISGLNGVLLGVAKKRGIPGICLLGEIPMYLQMGIPFYPRASKSILEVLTSFLGIGIDLSQLELFCQETERQLEALYANFPPFIREQLEQLRRPEAITEEDRKKIMEGVEELFRQREGEQDEPRAT